MVEPEKKFISYAKLNINKIASDYISNIRIYTKPISSKEYIFSLKNNRSSSSQLSSSSYKIKAISLDSIIPDDWESNTELLIKIDIDGFDWDAIISGKNIISKLKPLLFFECVILNNLQFYGYKSIIKLLLDNYDYILVLNNFGCIYFTGALSEDVLNNIFIKSYIASRKNNNEYYYFDILVYNIHQKSLINKAIECSIENS